MSFKRLFVLLGAVLLSASSFSQQVKKRYKWKYLGPSVIPASNVDTGEWTSTGVGWIEDVLISDKWYASSITGGVYRSNNEGKKWVKLDKFNLQEGVLDMLKISDELFISTGLTHYDEKFGSGVYRSSNNGKTWQPTGLQFKPTDLQPVWALAHQNERTLIACTPENIYVSHDLGLNWSLSVTKTKCDFRSLLVSLDHSRIYAAGANLMTSADSGESWQDITDRLSVFTKKGTKPVDIQRIAICNDPSKVGRMMAFYADGRTAYVDESLDFGNTWVNLHTSKRIRRADVHHTEIAIPPNNPTTIVLGTYRAYVSTNGGKTFRVATIPEYGAKNFTHDDIRGLQLVDAGEFYLATDGGVFQSLDTGKTWNNVSGKGLNAMQIYGITLLRNGSLLVGCQDLGTFLVNGKEWLNLGDLYGDGGESYELQDHYIVQMGGTLRRMNQETLHGINFVHPPSGGRPFTSKLVAYPGAIDSFFYVGTDLWYNNDSKWVNKTKRLKGGEYEASGFDINPKNPNQLFFAYEQPTWNAKQLKNKFFKSTDTGKTWVDITQNLPILAWRHITSISSNPNNPNEVLVSLGTLDVEEIHKVYRSLDGGETWQNYSEGLPQYQTFKIVHIPNSTGVIVSMLDGIYYRNAQMKSWQKLSGKIPNIAIRDFDIDYDGRWLYAGTYGNGLWKLRIPRKMLKF